MSVRLLLLLALVGPFCAFTLASPTELPEDLSTYSAEKDEPISTVAATTEGFSTPASLAPSTEPTTTPTEADTVPKLTTVLLTETNTPNIQTTTAVTDVLTSDPITPAAETEEPTELVETVQTVVVKGAEADVGEEVVVEDEAAEGLGSGQVVGIVIGALLAVIVVIAVVIVVVRRMGKYSP